MSNVTIIGAGKTGRGFVGRLMAEADTHVRYIDKDTELVEKLKNEGSLM